MTRQAAATVLGIVLAVLAGIGSARAESFYVETFETGNAGWIVSTESGFSPADWDPAGHITATIGSDPVRKLQAGVAALYEGLDRAALFATDMMITGDIDNADQGYVRFYVASGGEYFTTTKDASWTPAATAGWESFSVALVEANFERWGGGASVPLVDALNAPEEIGLLLTGASLESVGFTGAGGASISIDNFDAVPVPEPFTVVTAFLAVSSFGLYVRRHTRNSKFRKEVPDRNARTA